MTCFWTFIYILTSSPFSLYVSAAVYKSIKTPQHFKLASLSFTGEVWVTSEKKKKHKHIANNLSFLKCFFFFIMMYKKNYSMRSLHYYLGLFHWFHWGVRGHFDLTDICMYFWLIQTQPFWPSFKFGSFKLDRRFKFHVHLSICPTVQYIPCRTFFVKVTSDSRHLSFFTLDLLRDLLRPADLQLK